MNTLRYFASDKDTHFTGALAQNAIENESINMPTDWQTAGKQKITISEINLQADEDLDMELVLWSSSSYSNTDLDLDKMITRISFTAATAEQIAGAGQYYYENPLVQSIEYIDEDNTSKVHIGLVCRDASGKSAGASGETVVRIGASVQ